MVFIITIKSDYNKSSFFFNQVNGFNMLIFRGYLFDIVIPNMVRGLTSPFFDGTVFQSEKRTVLYDRNRLLGLK